MLKRGAFALLFVVILGAVIWVGDVLGDRQYRADVIGAAPLYSLPPHEYPSSNPLVSTLRPGEQLKVLRVRYGKDFEALKVETEGGHVGWVIGGEGIKVVYRG
jgi:hypothetical protein